MRAGWIALALTGIVTACGKKETARQADSSTQPISGGWAYADSNCVVCWLVPVGPEPIVIERQVYGAKLLRLGNEAHLVLDTLLRHEADGRAVWEIKARFALGVLQDSQTVANSCGPSQGDADLRTIAVVRPVGTGDYQVLRAWRIRPEAFAIDTVASSSITCFIEGWGEEAP